MDDNCVLKLPINGDTLSRIKIRHTTTQLKNNNAGAPNDNNNVLSSLVTLKNYQTSDEDLSNLVEPELIINSIL